MREAVDEDVFVTAWLDLTLTVIENTVRPATIIGPSVIVIVLLQASSHQITGHIDHDLNGAYPKTGIRVAPFFQQLLEYCGL